MSQAGHRAAPWSSPHGEGGQKCGYGAGRPGLPSCSVEPGPGSRGAWTSCCLLPRGPRFAPLSSEGRPKAP